MSAAPRTAAPTETGTTAVLAGLRVALHVTFAALLTVGLARALADRSPEASSGPFPATTLVLLTAALAATRGNQIRAADLLGLNRNTLRKKIRDLDIQVYRSGG